MHCANKHAHNNGMHPTADTTDVINIEWFGAAGDARVRRRDGAKAQGSEERGWRETYRAASGLPRNLGAA